MATVEERQKYLDDGYLAIENFLDEEGVEALKKECADLVDAMDPAEHDTVFSTTTHTHRNNYFMDSADKIGYFFEEGAKDEKTGELKVAKELSINKIGHAMHVLCPKFRAFCCSDKIKAVTKNLGYLDPVIVQSMYIFKQPHIGGVVTPHQDGSYIYTEPFQNIMGMWLALEDATPENGCMWFAPGSHKKGLMGDYRFIRNPEQEGPTCIYTGTKPTFDLEYVQVPVKKGTLVLIDGLVVHKSLPNTSSKSRNIFTFHLYDHGVGKWSEKNWMQPLPTGNFTHIYDVQV